jgi:hypothetical protein
LSLHTHRRKTGMFQFFTGALLNRNVVHMTLDSPMMPDGMR